MTDAASWYKYLVAYVTVASHDTVERVMAVFRLSAGLDFMIPRIPPSPMLSGTANTTMLASKESLSGLRFRARWSGLLENPE
jgi:hypothetical protein